MRKYRWGFLILLTLIIGCGIVIAVASESEQLELIPTVKLIRLEEGAQGTFGVLIICGQVFCFTLEPSDWLNERNISSIPVQQYKCVRTMSSRFGETFEIVDVPGRSHVLFHAGKLVQHTKGCVLLVQYFDRLEGNRVGVNSRKTFKKFMEIMKDTDVFHLTIKEMY